MAEKEKTTWIWNRDHDDGKTFDESAPLPPIRGGSDDSTRLMGSGHGVEETDDRTILAGFSDDEGSAQEPVAGWLVIVKGPGRGTSINIASGQSNVGRGTDQRISIPFGDNSISRRDHARIIYDPRSRKFFVLSGEGQNLTRVNDELLLRERELEGGELITMGETEMRFVPFCNAGFDWSDVSDKPEEES